MLNILIAGGISAILSMGLGMFWYGKSGFGPLWMKLTGISMDDMKSTHNGMTPLVGMLLGFLSTFVKACILAWLFVLLAPFTIFEAFGYALLFWLGFQATIDIGAVLWAMKSWKLFYLNTGYNLIVTLLMALVAFYII